MSIKDVENGGNWEVDTFTVGSEAIAILTKHLGKNIRSIEVLKTHPPNYFHLHFSDSKLKKNIFLKIFFSS
jgi:hypothetical protein